MRFNSYYAFKDDAHHPLNTCSRESKARPFLLNCIGNFVTDAKFNTYNQVGRSDYYLLYVQSGTLEVILPSCTELCGAGSFVVFPPGTKYRYRHAEGTTLDYLWVHFTGSAVDDTIAEYSIAVYPEINHINDDGGIGMRFLNMLEIARGPDTFKEAELSLSLARLLLSLAKRMGEQKPSKLYRSLNYINENFSCELRICELAKMENLSESRYTAVFRETMNTSPHSYITELRIASACELLRTTDLPIKAIAAAVGYNDSHFFSRIFTKRMHMSPLKYRNQIL